MIVGAGARGRPIHIHRRDAAVVEVIMDELPPAWQHKFAIREGMFDIVPVREWSFDSKYLVDHFGNFVEEIYILTNEEG